MTENVSELETVYKKVEELDSELNTFIRAVKEIKEIRETVNGLPDRLKSDAIEIENQKKRLDNLMSSTHDVLITFEEKSKGIIFDLEKKTDDMAGEVKSSIAEFEKKFNRSSDQFQDLDRGHLEHISAKQEELEAFCKSLHRMVSENEGLISTLKNDHMTASGIRERLESSIVEMKKNILALQRRPYEIENKMIKMEERLTALIDEKNKRQKTFSWILLFILIAGIVLSCTFFYMQ